MRLSIAAAGAACLLLLGCSSGEKKAQKAARTERAPDSYRVLFDTGKGPFIVEVTRDWAPRGADRFYNLVRSGFYNGARFFRVLPNFVVQFGINGDPATSRLWSAMRIPDDPVKASNEKGTITYATSGPESRTTQVFINLRDNARLDGQGFAPFGKVISGMEVVERLYSSYGDGPPRGNGPDQNLIETQGNSYLEQRFPRLDYISKATVQ